MDRGSDGFKDSRSGTQAISPTILFEGSTWKRWSMDELLFGY
jgi:hypothetical protein